MVGLVPKIIFNKTVPLTEYELNLGRAFTLPCCFGFPYIKNNTWVE